MKRNIKKYLVLIFLSAVVIFYFYPEKSLDKEIKIDRIIVYKNDRKMYIYSHDKLIKKYNVSLGRGEYGIVDKDWNNKTPIGDFKIDGKILNSQYHKALTISYGNQIEIHGMKNGYYWIGKLHTFVDWTRGCIAVTDKEIDELYTAVGIGTHIFIRE